MSKDYDPPKWLIRIGVSSKDYHKWLNRRASAHVKRDKKKGIREYKQAIHRAVKNCNGKDAYTGKKLKWRLISKWNNEESKKIGRDYKKKFRDLPTVDHVDRGKRSIKFVICSWEVNDSKGALRIGEFYKLCEDVLDYRSKQKRKI
jgi:hypothetical protein